MLDSSTMTFVPFKDNRTKKDPRFVGMSGRLLLGTDANGNKYLVKHTYAHNAANEYTACWLAEKMGIFAPKAYLLTKARRFASKYAVAIEFFDSLQNFSKDDVPNKSDLIDQFALCALIDTGDTVQLGRVGDRIISYDFSEGFIISDLRMRQIINVLSLSSEIGMGFLKENLWTFDDHVRLQSFNLPGLAKEFHIDADEFQHGMIKTAKRVETISDDDLKSLTDELSEMYPMEIAVFYEMCIRSMQDHMRNFAE